MVVLSHPGRGGLLCLEVGGWVGGLEIHRRMGIWRIFFKENWVVVSNIFYFHPYLGKISNLSNIFQMG